jgi:hypothetical protein
VNDFLLRTPIGIAVKRLKKGPKAVPSALFEETALYNMLLVESLIELFREKRVPGGDAVKGHAKKQK